MPSSTPLAMHVEDAWVITMLFRPRLVSNLGGKVREQRTPAIFDNDAHPLPKLYIQNMPPIY